MPQVSPETILPGCRNLDDVLRYGHRIVTGDTGSGKSKWLVRAHNRTALDVAVYVSPHREQLRGATARTARDVRRLIAEGQPKIGLFTGRIVTKADRAHVQAELHQVVGDLMDLGEKVRGRSEAAAPWLLLTFDEAQRYAPKHGGVDNPIEIALTEIRKFGGRVNVGTQRYAKISQDAMTQARVHIFFLPSPFDEPYFRRYNVPVDEFRNHISRPHYFVMLSGQNWVPYEPIGDWS